MKRKRNASEDAWIHVVGRLASLQVNADGLDI